MNSTRKILGGFLRTLTVAVAALTSVSAAQAGAIFTLNSGSFQARAEFSYVGTTLTIALTNTSTGLSAYTPGNVLTGLFFDINGGATLTPVSAIVAGGSVINGGYCSLGPCNSSTTNVGGEFRYVNSASGFSPVTSAQNGIASAGYSSLTPNFGPTGNFNGTNLDGPDSPAGAQFGLVGNDYNLATANGGASVALIKNSVTFTLSGLAANFNLSKIGNVSFAYGTAPDSVIAGSTGSVIVPDAGVPEPASLVILGGGLVALGLLRRKRPA